MKNKFSGKFSGWLNLQYINGREWKIINPLTDHSFCFVLSDQRCIIPENGFVTDFASIPRLFWRILPPVGDGSRARYGLSAVIHDWLYVHGKIEGKPIEKKVADDIFLAAMEAVEVVPWKRIVMYAAVAMFGGRAWKKHR